MLGVAYKNVAFPLCFRMLDKRGNSNTGERIALIRDFIAWFGRDRIDCLLADREFVGEEWLGFLNRENIRYPVRISQQFQGILSEKTKGNQGLAPVQRPEGGRAKALSADRQDKRPVVLSFRDKDGQGRQSGSPDPGLLQQTGPGPGTVPDAMAGGDPLSRPEVQRVQYRGYPCGRPGEAGEIDAPGHDRICLVLQDRGFHRHPPKAHQDQKTREKGGECMPIWTGLPLQGIDDRTQ